MCSISLAPRWSNTSIFTYKQIVENEITGDLKLRIIATQKLREAQQRYPAAHMHLDGWYQIISQSDFGSEHALRATFGDIRGFNFQYKFPIPETTLLVHTLINFESQVAYIDTIKPGNH